MMITALKWGNLGAIYYFLIPLILLVTYIVTEKYSQRSLAQAFGQKVSAYLSQNLWLLGRRIKLIIQCIALVFIIVSLLRPQTNESLQEVKSEGIEVLILADVSDSMLAEDVKPSRLTQMKVEMNRLIEMMPGNKTGIIAFAGSSSLLSPLTSDPNALRMYIDSLDTDSVSSQGTNFETALTYAKEAFEKGGVTQDASTQTTRIVLVVSDGEDQEKGALEKAELLTKDGVKIFSIAYGTEKGGAIPEYDRNREMVGFKKDRSGQTVLTKVKGEFLKSLAEAGGGKFYFSQIDGGHLKNIVEDIGQLEKTQFQSSIFAQYEEKFSIPLLLGIVLLFVSFLISDRKSAASITRGKYEFN